MGYVGPETMFLLSLSPEGRESLTDLVEEALQLRLTGLTTKEIEDRLDSDLTRLESTTSTPRMVRKIVLGEVPLPEPLND